SARTSSRMAAVNRPVVDMVMTPFQTDLVSLNPAIAAGVLNKIAIVVETPWSDANNPLKAAGEVALIGKAQFAGGPPRAYATVEECFGALDARIQQIFMRRQADTSAKYPQQMEGA